MSTIGNGQLANDARTKLEAYHLLRQAHQLWDAAADSLYRAVGVPLCVEKCGRCCEVTVPVAIDLEADYAVSILLGLPTSQQIIATLEAWLTEFDVARGITTPVGHPITVEKQMAEGEAVQGSCCPLLGADKKCLLYEARPLGCRAYGVTTAPHQFCRRPHLLGAAMNSNLYCLQGQAVLQMNTKVEPFQRASRAVSGFFPSLIFSKVREAQFRELVQAEKVPLVKLSAGPTRRPWRLFEIEPLPKSKPTPVVATA